MVEEVIKLTVVTEMMWTRRLTWRSTGSLIGMWTMSTTMSTSRRLKSWMKIILKKVLQFSIFFDQLDIHKDMVEIE